MTSSSSSRATLAMPMRRRHPKNGDPSHRAVVATHSPSHAALLAAAPRPIRQPRRAATTTARAEALAPRGEPPRHTPRWPARQRSAPVTDHTARTRAHSPSRAALQLEQQDCSNSGEGKALLSRKNYELQLPPTHDLKQAQNVCVQRPQSGSYKVGRAAVDDVLGVVALLLSLRLRRVVQHPKQACRALTAPPLVVTHIGSSSHRANVCRPSGGRALTAPACRDPRWVAPPSMTSSSSLRC
jgi:hypothetical protein